MTQIKHERSTQDLVRAAVSGWLGTALEFMDFQLYSLGAALVFHEIFFPEQSAAMALILAMGTYGAGYIARIIGAFVFGKMGDRIGRKKVLFITITMMGICTTLIGVLPTYAQIGIFAPVLLVTLRIIQGLGAGAEIFGSRNRFTRMAISKEAGGLVAVGFGPVLAGIFCNMTDSWLPILIMLVLYSCIGLISALLMPEVRDRDLSLPEDAAEATAAEKLRHSATQTS
ncbi:MHS family MFS transporter [Salmonella enterica subsp. enterica serovar Hermannswerder]|nr:MHS family MFS transporter [Salmonella enterica subsp. enterica]EEJ0026417.1 MHS family MFS transporter [Salmonella enterica subsp. enterica]EGI6164326.1 MHS family MFS transporter [Salmonella enterica subsp. enterica serovar Hermannswerder]HAF3702040.1 MHS family MFS transporter [Salmonella enterica]HAK8081612.1 MHS family MFS transporter [Salmonella enterica]